MSLEDEVLDMCDPFGEAPENPGDHPFHAGGLAKQRRRSIALPRGVITDGVLKDDEDAQAPAHQKSEGYSSLPFTYEATVEAGFDCERVGDAIKKECQDKAYIDEVFANQESQAVVAILDGHGTHGKKASHDVCSYFIDSVANAKLDSARDIKAAMTAACLRAETVLELSPYDTRVSGTTLTAVLLRENELCVAWVGDSRAVLAVWQPNHRMKAVDISRDHKPDDRREKRRIESMGGEVKRFDIPDDDDDDDLPWWVFIRGTMIPGLAMSRPIGDTLATRQVGAIPQPDFGTRVLTENDSFLIVASDGLWEVFSSQEAVEWTQRYILENREEDGSLPGHGSDPKSTSVSVAIATEAQRRWVVNYDAKCIVDDTSVAIVYLKNKLYQDQKQTVAKTRRGSALFMDHSQLRKTVTMFVKRQIEESERASSTASPRSRVDEP